MQHILLRETPKTLITTSLRKLKRRNTVNSCSRVIILRVFSSFTIFRERKDDGQSAVLLSKFVMIEYERHSTTERIWVSNEGLINQKRLKIQSSPCVFLNTINIQKWRVVRSIFKLIEYFLYHTLRHFSHNFLFLYFLNNFLKKFVKTF